MAGAIDTQNMSMPARIKAILIGSAGNLVEWYDFYAYAAFALYFAPAFFPNDNPVVQQLNASILFAVTFVARPLGGWLFGWIADRYGRRLSLMVSVGLMCFGSLIIAVTPVYATIGLWASVILAAARILQGLSLGGEYGASAAYLTEMADEKNRGFYSSFQYVTLIGGQLCALLVLLVLQNILGFTAADLKAGGWRIPFVIGALLAVFTLFMRRRLPETEAYKVVARQAKKQASILTLVLKYPRETLLVVGLTAGGTAAFYTYTTYMQKFLKLSVKLSDTETTFVAFWSLIFAMILQPIYGAISDRIGRKWLLIGFGVSGVLFTIPLLTTLQQVQGVWPALLLICAAWLIVSGYTSINAVVKAELFPTTVRAMGVAVPYALTVSIFGGTAEPIALYFKQAGVESYFYYYLTGIIALSLVIYVLMRDTKKTSAMNRMV